MRFDVKFGYKSFTVLALVLLCQDSSGANLGEVGLTVSDQHFAFDVVVENLPASLSTSSLSFYTKFNLFIPPANQEQFLVRFVSQTGAITDGPAVHTLGNPDRDRWQDGAIEDFMLTEISPGTWRFTGMIAHGNDRYVPCDRIGEIRLEYPGGTALSGSNSIASVPFPAMSLVVNPSTKLITAAGQIVDYQYVITNEGQVILHNVALSDDDVDAPPVCDFVGTNELAPRGDLHSKVICTAQRTVTQEELLAENRLINHVSATADEAGPVLSTVTIPIGLFVDGFEGHRHAITVLDDTSCDVGRYSSIATGTDGYPLISYYDVIEGTVKFIKCNDAACSGHDEMFSIVDHFAQGDTSLALGNDGLPVIAYAKYDDLGSYWNVAKCNDVSCADGDETITSLDGPGTPGNALAAYNSLAIGVDGLPVMSSYNQAALRVVKCNDAQCTGGDETLSVVDQSEGAPGAWSSLAIGVDGFPVISYHEHNPGVLKFAKCNDPACTDGDEATTILDNTTDYAGRYTSIAIGEDGFPIISYSNEYDWELRVVKCNDAACSGGNETRTVVDSQARGFTSIAIGEDGLPVIAYTGGSQWALKVAKCNDAACSGNDEAISLVDPASSGWVSLTIGADGFPVISYFDTEQLVLKVAHCGNTDCSQ